VRDITTATLDAWVAQSGLDSFVPYLPKAISVDNSVARKEVLAWLVKHQATFTKAADVKTLIKPVIVCLQDRTPEVMQLVFLEEYKTLTHIIFRFAIRLSWFWPNCLPGSDLRQSSCIATTLNKPPRCKLWVYSRSSWNSNEPH